MGATRDAVGLIGGVLRSLISLIDGGDETKGSSEHTPHDWQTNEEKVNAARRLSILRRKMAYCDRMTPTPKTPTAEPPDTPQDTA